ncbi:MAG: hypothetical protein ABSD20_14010 [Terriglobales bacterium]
MLYCPRCDSARVHVSAAGNPLDKLFYRITLRRFYRCEDCDRLFPRFIWESKPSPGKRKHRHRRRDDQAGTPSPE